MAIFCLAKNLNDLQERINKIIVAFDSKNKPIYVSDLGITGAIIKILTNGKAI
jgi:formate--tetrahydrofolate ligase